MIVGGPLVPVTIALAFVTGHIGDHGKAVLPTLSENMKQTLPSPVSPKVQGKLGSRFFF